jgi:flagellum-specific peptidoglycan hydrolase FlgJ
MSEEDAALHLAKAWQSVMSDTSPREALSLLWAHWAHETGRGRRMYGFNFGGLKGRGPGGTGVLTWTREASGESRGLVQRTFRAYPSAEAGARDYLELLAGRFPSAISAARRGNVTRFVHALSRRGYFTDDAAAYARAITSLSFECKRRRLIETALLRAGSLELSK